MDLQMPQKQGINSQGQQKKVKNQVPIVKTKKIKKSLLKLKSNYVHIPPYLNIKYIYRLGDAAMINQQSFRDPKHSALSYFGAMFLFKRIQALNIDKDFITLNLKIIPQSMLPVEYAIERFKSFNDKDFNEIAENIQKINDQFNYMRQQKIRLKQNTLHSQNPLLALQAIRDKQEEDLRKLTDTIGKNSQTLKIGIYYKESQLGLSINKVILSTKLLQILGVDIFDMVQQYTKFKTINFQIFSSEYYRFIFSQLIKISAQVMKKSRNKQNINYQDLYVASKGFVFKKRKVNNLQIQQKVHADIVFRKLAPNISYFQISNIHENGIILVGPDEQNSIRKLQFDPTTNIQDQIEKLSQQNIDQKVIFSEQDNQNNNL